ncbi:MAG TPA: hypothetical protein VH092_34885 [Urbifossiella sp.]|jgi:hypothetical protein|nr:hypothetical protein [Urbifossiella sp.]
MPTKNEAARALAHAHFAVEPGLTRVFRVLGTQEDTDAEPVKLLEVNAATVPTGVVPLYFGPVPARGMPYPSVVVEVTPAEYDQLRRGELRLPGGWVVGDEIAAPAAAAGVA